jgi:hypothetical protein
MTELPLIISLVLLVVVTILDFYRDAIALFADKLKKRAKWMTFDPLAKYINRDPSQGRTRWYILGFAIPIHVFFTDGWHKIKTFYVFVYLLIPSILQTYMPWWQFFLFGSVIWLLTWYILEQTKLKKEK